VTDRRIDGRGTDEQTELLWLLQRSALELGLGLGLGIGSAFLSSGRITARGNVLGKGLGAEMPYTWLGNSAKKKTRQVFVTV